MALRTKVGLCKYHACMCMRECVCKQARQAHSLSKQCDGISSGLTRWFGSPLGRLWAPETGALVFVAFDKTPHSLCGSSFSLPVKLNHHDFSSGKRLHIQMLNDDRPCLFWTKSIRGKMISTSKDTIGGDKLLNNLTFLVAQGVGGALINVFTALSCLSSNDWLRPFRFMAHELVSSSNNTVKTHACKHTRVFRGDMCFLSVLWCLADFQKRS